MNRRVFFSLFVLAFLDLAAFSSIQFMIPPPNDMAESVVGTMKPDDTRNAIAYLRLVLPLYRDQSQQLHKCRDFIIILQVVVMINFFGMLLVIGSHRKKTMHEEKGI